MNRSPELTPDLVELICAEIICPEVTLSIYSKPHVEEKDEHIPSIVSCFLRCSVSSVAGALSRVMAAGALLNEGQEIFKEIQEKKRCAFLQL